MLTKHERTHLAHLRKRNADSMRSNEEAVTRNSITAIGAGIFADEKFLIGLVDRLTEEKFKDDKSAEELQASETTGEEESLP